MHYEFKDKGTPNVKEHDRRGIFQHDNDPKHGKNHTRAFEDEKPSSDFHPTQKPWRI